MDDVPRDAAPSPPVAPTSGAARHGRMHPVAFGFVTIAAVFVTYQIVGSVATVLALGVRVTPGNVVGMRIATAAAQFLFLLLPVVLLVRFQGWDVRSTLRLRGFSLRDAALVIAAVIALQFFFQGYVAAQEFVLDRWIIPAPLKPLIDKLVDLIDETYRQLLAMHSGGELVAVLLVIAVTPAICEEVVFRGAVQRAFERGMRLRWAWLLSGAIFAAFHLNPVSFLPLTALGAMLSAVVWRSGSLPLAMLAHATNNAFAVVAYYFTGRDDVVAVGGGAFWPIAGTSAAGLALAVVAFASFWRRPSPAVPASV